MRQLCYGSYFLLRHCWSVIKPWKEQSLQVYLNASWAYLEQERRNAFSSSELQLEQMVAWIVVIFFEKLILTYRVARNGEYLELHCCRGRQEELG